MNNCTGKLKNKKKTKNLQLYGFNSYLFSVKCFINVKYNIFYVFITSSGNFCCQWTLRFIKEDLDSQKLKQIVSKHIIYLWVAF